jgi:hypothetical protein
MRQPRQRVWQLQLAAVNAVQGLAGTAMQAGRRGSSGSSCCTGGGKHTWRPPKHRRQQSPAAHLVSRRISSLTTTGSASTAPMPWYVSQDSCPLAHLRREKRRPARAPPKPPPPNSGPGSSADLESICGSIAACRARGGSAPTGFAALSPAAPLGAAHTLHPITDLLEAIRGALIGAGAAGRGQGCGAGCRARGGSKRPVAGRSMPGQGGT